MNKIFIFLLLCTSFLFAARVTVNVNGVESTHILASGDKLQFSSDEDTLYLKTADSTITYVLGNINRISLDTIGGGLGYVNILNTANTGVLALPLSSVDGIIFEPDAKDTADWDGDDLTNYDEMVIYGTDPKKWDTDGDGFSDYMELTQFSSASDNFSFNPLIADLPSVKVTMTKYPAVSINYTTSTDSTKTASITEGTAVSKSKSSDYSHETTESMEHGWEASIDFGYEGGSAKVVGHAGASGSYSESETYNWGTSTGISNETSYEESQETATSKGWSADGGTARFYVKLANTGNLAIAINSLLFNAYVLNNTGDTSYWSLFTGLTDNYSYPFTLGLNQTVDMTLTADLNLTETYQLLSADLMKCLLSAYSFSYTDEDGVTRDFTAASTNTAARTASVVVDYGPDSQKDPISAKVAVLTNYNPDHRFLDDMYTPVTLKDVLRILKVNWSDSVGTNGITSVNGIANESAIAGYWYVVITSSDGDSTSACSSRFGAKSCVPDSITVLPGELVQIVFTYDEDGDSLSAYLEAIYGTSDLLMDTDGDGISDWREVEGWKDGDSTWVTDPTSWDSDGDGRSDTTDENPEVPYKSRQSNALRIDVLTGNSTVATISNPSATSVDTLTGNIPACPRIRVVLDSAATSVTAYLNGDTLALSYVATDTSSMGEVSLIYESDSLPTIMAFGWDTLVVVTKPKDKTSSLTRTYRLAGESKLMNAMSAIAAGNPSPASMKVAGDRWKQLQTYISGGKEQKILDPRTDGVLIFRTTNNSSLDISDTSKQLPTGQVIQNWTLLGSMSLVDSSITVTDTELASGTTYYYKVVPYAKENLVYHYAPSTASASDSTWKLMVKAKCDSIYVTNDRYKWTVRSWMLLESKASTVYGTIDADTIVFGDTYTGWKVSPNATAYDPDDYLTTVQSEVGRTDSVRVRYILDRIPAVGDAEIKGDVIFAAHNWYEFRAENLFTSSQSTDMSTIFSATSWASLKYGLGWFTWSPSFTWSQVATFMSDTNQVSLLIYDDPGNEDFEAMAVIKLSWWFEQ